MNEFEQLIVSVSGVRGIVGRGLTPQVALAFASAFAEQIEGKPVVLSRDGRPSGVMLWHAIVAGLTAGGSVVHDLGVCPTPTVGVAIQSLQAAGGIQITASHNAAPWNGLKLFGSDGRVLSAAISKEVQARFEAGARRCVPYGQLGSVVGHRQAERTHCERVLPLVDLAKIRAAGLRAFVDANGGAGGRLARQLLDALGVVGIIHGDAMDGVFLHEPEPTAENLQAIAPLVPAHQADVGFALDPDSDRLALIDENGVYIGEELTLALAAQFRLSRDPGPVVINMSTSRLTADLAEQHGVACHRAAVGEANVVDRMLEVGAVLGGEGNGGVIDPRVVLVRDPFVGMAFVLNLLAETGKPLSALVAELPAYHIVKEKYSVSRDRLPMLFEAMCQHWPKAVVDRQDGLRLDWPDRWLHVRPSNTEPIVRVIAEAPDRATAAALCAEMGNLLDAR